MTDRALQTEAFLTTAGWATARRRFLAGDASDRTYERLTRDGETAVLMNAPPGKGDDPAQFVAMAQHLLGLGLSAPHILAQDLPHGFLLLEDLGDGLFARILQDDPAREADLYASATDVLIHLQQALPPPGMTNLTAQDWATAGAFVLDWYRFAATGERIGTQPFVQVLTDAMTLADGPRVLILRDFHAENLLWLPARNGLARTGLLDFQLGQLGQPGYDLVSLLQDARRDVTPQVEKAMIARFASATGVNWAAFQQSYTVLGAQRALRILGIFARLCLVAGKAGYIDLIPRVWGQLQRNLEDPALTPLKNLCDDLLPHPKPAILEKIKSQCGLHPLP